MAFVNRSPRGIQKLPKKPHYQDDYSDQNDQQQIRGPILKKSPKKGLAFPNFKTSINNQHLNSNEKIQNLELAKLQKEVTASRSKPKEDHTQYVFKSKCSRDLFAAKEAIFCQHQTESVDYSKQRLDIKFCTITQESKTANLLEAIKKVKKIDKTPSIPGKMEKFGYIAKNKEDGFKYPQKVNRPRFQGVKGDNPGPGQYDFQIKPKIKGTIMYSQKKSYNHSSEATTNGFFALISDQQAMNLHNQKLQEWVKKKQKPSRVGQIFQRKVELRTRQKSQYSDSDSGVTVYDDDTTPGPGYYHFQKQTTKQFRSKKEKFQKIFYNKSQRFENVKQNEQDSLDFLEPKKLGKDKKFYISKLKRDLNLGNKSVSPDYYDTRQNIEHDAISKVLRNSPNLYNNRIPRILNFSNSQNPGPGFYNPSIPTFKVQSFPSKQINQTKDLMKGHLKQLFNTREVQLLKNKGNNINSRIHQRKDQIVQNQNFAPFLSTSPKSTKNQSSKVPHCYFPVKKSPLLAKNKQNCAPFNTSAERGMEKKENIPVGVGLYDLESIESWDTKSFNTLFN